MAQNRHKLDILGVRCGRIHAYTYLSRINSKLRMFDVQAMCGGEDVTLAEYAASASAHVSGLCSSQPDRDLALPRPRVLTSLHAADDSRQRHGRRDGRRAAFCCKFSVQRESKQFCTA